MHLQTSISWIARLPCIHVICIGKMARYERRPVIFDLPPELMGIIFDFLPIVCKACLALSCKILYYHFGYILQAAVFHYPNLDRQDYISKADRMDLLKRLESPWRPFLYLKSRHWRYCYACLKLHPRSQFNNCDIENRRDPAHPRCMWPGVIVLCPCLVFSPKNLKRIYREACRAKHFNNEHFNNKAHVNTGGLKIKNHLPNWHQCIFDSPCQRLSCRLTISVSLSEGDDLHFDFHYLVSFDQDKPYRGEKSIKLCPHKDILKAIAGRKSQPFLRIGYVLVCCDCRIYPSVYITKNFTEYNIRFTRRFRKSEWRSRGNAASIADYNWARYGNFLAKTV